MINYDSCGRMTYNPELHDRQGESWAEEEVQYVIDWYDRIGVEEMSLALGRTETSLAAKVNSLRRKGLMKPKENYDNKIPRLLRFEHKENLIWRAYA